MKTGQNRTKIIMKSRSRRFFGEIVMPFRRYASVLSAIRQRPFGDTSTSFRRYANVLSAIRQRPLGENPKGDECMISHQVYNMLIFNLLPKCSALAYF